MSFEYKVNVIDGVSYTVRLDNKPCTVNWRMGVLEVAYELERYEQARVRLLHMANDAMNLHNLGHTEEADRIVRRATDELDVVVNRYVGILLSSVRLSVLKS